MMAVQRWLSATVMLLAVMVARGDDGWRFQVGGAYQWGMKMNTRGPALTALNNYTSADPGAQTYADGYVHRDVNMDSSSGSPSDYDHTYTWNWSYANANQYNSVDHTLAFHSQESTSTSDTGDKDFNAAGVEFSARHDLLSCCGLNVGIDFDLAWFPGMHVSQTRTATSRYTTDYYSTATYGGGNDIIGVLGDPASYTGPDYTDSGNLDRPGLLYTPILITDTLEQMAVTTKADLYRVRAGLGPTLSVPITDKLSLYATPQFTMSLVRAEVTRNQTTTSTDMNTHITTPSSSEASNEKTAFLAGFLLAAGLDYHFAPNWVVGACVGHEWIPDTLSVGVGSDRTHLNLGGGEASVYVGMKF